MKKHAYLIMAHKVDETFKVLLHMIDDERNEIFVHMDKKAKNYDESVLQREVKKSKIYFTKRINVMWGGVSQINAELILLRSASTVGTYEYYHLLSGNDLPIQTQDDIHSFFDKENGKEFIGFVGIEQNVLDRWSFYHLFQEYIGNGNIITNKCNEYFIKLQQVFHINRRKGEQLVFRKGVNWFSITDSFARYVVEKESWIKQTFRMTRCCDEVFLQTLAINSTFIKNIYSLDNSNDNMAAMRYIDWNRGNPYIFRTEDYKELIDSKMLFARKFDSSIDRNIVRMIQDFYTKN